LSNEILIVLDPANLVEELDESNNRALLRVIVRDGRIIEESVSYFSTEEHSKAGEVKTNVQIEVGRSAATGLPAAMVGTWFFDNPQGDEEQMAIFPDGRVVVLYSNGHKDETHYDNGFMELAEYDHAKCRMSLQEDGMLVQYFNYSERFGTLWRRIDPQPRTNLLRPLTGQGSSKTDVQVEVERR